MLNITSLNTKYIRIYMMPEIKIIYVDMKNMKNNVIDNIMLDI